MFSAGRSYQVCPGETLVTGGANGPGSVNPADPVLGGLDRTENKLDIIVVVRQVFPQVKQYGVTAPSLHCTVRHCTVPSLHRTVRHCTVLSVSARYCPERWHCAVCHCTVLSVTSLYYPNRWHCTARHSTVLSLTAPYCPSLHRAVRHCPSLSVTVIS